MKYSQHKSPEESIGLVFWQVSTLWQRAIKDALRKYNLTHTQYVILAVIEELQQMDEKITQKKISDFSMIDIMTISSTLKLLEKKGLTKKIPQENDIRANQISKMKAGTNLLKKAIKAVEAVDKQFFFEDSKSHKAFQTLLLSLKENNTSKI